MKIQEYIKKKKELVDLLLKYIENISEINNDYQALISFLEQRKRLQTSEELREIFHILLNIINNHHRNIDFFNKIEQIFNFLKETIKQTFSNLEIYDFFCSNNKILLLLIKNSIITIDESIFKQIQEDSKEKIFYFYPEIKSFLNSSQREEIEREMNNLFPNNEDFLEKRNNGENETHITELIRNDSVEEFIEYVNRLNYSISSKINHSIFETNSFLIENEPSLIEYAAFFGSIQIFQYLKMNGVKLNSSLWLYSIHSKNAELIHLLEENHVSLPCKSYSKCLEESIKCFHNDFANYFLINFFTDDEVKSQIENNFEKNIMAYCFHFHNYTFLPDDFNNSKFVFYYCCYYDYIKLVKFYLKTKDININAKIKKIPLNMNYNVFYKRNFIVQHCI